MLPIIFALFIVSLISNDDNLISGYPISFLNIVCILRTASGEKPELTDSTNIMIARLFTLFPGVH